MRARLIAGAGLRRGLSAQGVVGDALRRRRAGRGRADADRRHLRGARALQPSRAPSRSRATRSSPANSWWLRPGDAITVTARGAPGTAARFMLFGGAPMEGPRYIWWNFVSSRPERIEQAKEEWARGRFETVCPATRPSSSPCPDRTGRAAARHGRRALPLSRRPVARPISSRASTGGSAMPRSIPGLHHVTRHLGPAAGEPRLLRRPPAPAPRQAQPSTSTRPTPTTSTTATAQARRGRS